MQSLTVVENITKKIYLLRGHKVMLDIDLARLYDVKTKELNKAVKRNYQRFPADFIFQLSKHEYGDLRFQIGTSNRGGRRYFPYAFTEQGVAMLSSVLHSDRAARVNIAIMRAFVKFRDLFISNEELARNLHQLELKLQKHDRRFKKQGQHIKLIFDAIRQLMIPERSMGFRTKHLHQVPS